MKLTHKIIVCFILLIILVAAANTYSTSYVLKNLQEERLKTAEVIFSKSLSRRLYRAVIEERINYITDVLFEEKSLREEKIEYILVFNKKGYLLAHTYLFEMPKILIKSRHTFAKNEEYKLTRLQEKQLSVYEIAVPVMEGIKKVGTIHVGIRSDYVDNIITPTKTASKLSLIITLIITLIAVIIAIPLSKTIINPLVRLKTHSEKISEGDVSTQINIKSRDEIGDLANSINKMTADLFKINTELAQKNKELEQVVYVTSHDLRSPLVNINGYNKMIGNLLKEVVSILDSADISEETKQKVSSIIDIDIQKSEHYISTNVTKMNVLLSGLLQLSRIGKVEAKIENIDMNKMMIDIKDSISYEINEIGAKVEISELPSCSGDTSQFNQIFSNLLSNAVKYLDSTRPGVIEISGNIENNDIVYCVEDNGIGISPENQEKIFELFHQLKPGMGGEGLGLNIVQRIIEGYSGKIWLESEKDTGSKFFISVPNV